MRAARWPLLLVIAAACEAPAPAAPPEGVPTPVEVLDRAWVRFEGERRPVEYFLLEMRQRVRAAPNVAARPCPLVTIASGAAGVDARWLDWLRDQLHRAGVQRIVLGDS